MLLGLHMQVLQLEISRHVGHAYNIYIGKQGPGLYPVRCASDKVFYMQILGFPSGRHTLPSAINRDRHMTTSPNPAHIAAGSLALEYQGFPKDANRR